MSSSLSFVFLFAQAGPVLKPSAWLSVLQWMIAFGEPELTIAGYLGAVLGWLKIVGLYCLMGWVFSWVLKAYKNQQSVPRPKWIDIAGAVGLLGAVGCVLLQVLQSTNRMPARSVGGVSLLLVLGLASGFILLLWLERALWASVIRLGNRADLNVLAAMHLALGLGVVVAIFVHRIEVANRIRGATWANAVVSGFRYGGTYMGFVVLVRVIGLLIPELVSLRWRRLSSIASCSVKEANRKMWAPYVVTAIFLVVLAFTSWFLQAPPRAAEFGRHYVSTLTVLCSGLLTLMIVILTPLSLPTDIQNQTIYTVVSKPVRRLELVWGRMIGFMSMVTVLVLIFGGVSLAYLRRTVGGEIEATVNKANQAELEHRLGDARQLTEQADQMRNRMAARLPVKGSLTFLDSRGVPKLMGVDVGQELQYRSYIEGSTSAAAIWEFGVVEHPIDRYEREVARRAGRALPPLRHPLLDKRIAVADFLKPGTIEDLLNQAKEYEYASRENENERRRLAAENGAGNSDAEVTRLRNADQQNRKEVTRLSKEIDALAASERELLAKAEAEEKAGRATQATDLRATAAKLHSPDFPLEMIFTVYRTTKGRRVGEPVYASLKATNRATGEPYSAVFPIHEYYTNREMIPALLLAGSRGSLSVELKCLSDTQYLGMSEDDLYVLADSGNFGVNFMKGLFGVWLQAMILTAIGVFAGTFLSWPVAFLTTFAFWIAGLAAFGFLQQIADRTLTGGGPFESLVRVLSHNNQVNDLAPTLAVVAAKTLDAIVMPLLSRLAYVVPNLSVFDFSNLVSNGYAVTWVQIINALLLAVGYALPFSLTGYLILKNREVAA